MLWIEMGSRLRGPAACPGKEGTPELCLGVGVRSDMGAAGAAEQWQPGLEIGPSFGGVIFMRGFVPWVLGMCSVQGLRAARAVGAVE